MKPVCLVIGAGAGIGGNVGKRFASEGYHAVLCRRSDDEGLRTLVEGIEGEGGSASGFLMNASEPDEIEERIGNQIEMIVEGGPTGVEATTVIDLSGGNVAVLRLGRGDVSSLAR